MKFIDLHEDIQIYWQTPTLLGYQNDYLPEPFDQRSDSRQADLPGYRQAGTLIIFSSIFPYTALENNKFVPLPAHEITKLVAGYADFTAEYPDLVFLKNKNRLEQTTTGQKIGLLLHCEGLGTVNSKNDIQQLALRGVKSMGLCWNSENQLCSTCESVSDNGLKAKGREVVEEIIESKLILDLSHTSFKTQDEVLERYDYPYIIFSHTGIWDIFPFPQNVRLSVVKELHRRGGLIGLTLLDLMINGPHNSKIEHFIKHYEAVSQFENTICLGTDFFGFKMGRGIKDINRIDDLRLLYHSLRDEYGLSVTDNIFYLNAQKFLTQVL